ncbi:MAG TPA: acyl-CoA desaturase [Candidatus Saccharimonadales bacterium]|nr:acyl-CoA desaturase [Candidatus Saccharimonadales bacterium]
MKKQNDYQIKLTQLQGAKVYAQLAKEVNAAGILRRDYVYYTILTTLTLTAFFISLFFLYRAQSAVSLVLWSFPFSFFAVQIGGLMHDAGHGAIFSSVKNNDLAGRFFGGFVSFGYTSWKKRHNAHHAHPNNEETDDDVIDYPFLTFNEERVLKSKGISKTILKRQVFLYYLIQPLFAIVMRITFFVTYFQKYAKRNFVEIAFYSVGFFAWFILPFILFDFPKALFILVIPSLLSGAYMANIFAPNHKGMPIVKRGTKLSFFEEQIATSRDVDSNPILDYIYLGLNFQVEHHLFVNCPRNKLHLITPYLEKACRKTGIKFHRVDVIKSNKIILGELMRLSATI